MPSEPDWSKIISNNAVCGWFYFLALINTGLAIAGILAAFFMPIKGVTAPLLVSGTIGFINAWALFLVCSRGIGN